MLTSLLLAACAPAPRPPGVAELVGTSSTVDTAADPLDCDDPGAVCVVAGIPGLSGAENLALPIDMTVDPDGVLYVVDINHHRIVRAEPDGTLVPVAGTGFV